MNVTLREQIGHFVAANQGAVTGTLLFVVAFSVFGVNAMFNQPGAHPVPLWSSPKPVVTNSINIPVRRVETLSFRANKVPVPQLRPQPVPQAVATHPGTHPPAIPVPKLSNSLPVDVKKIQNLLARLDFYNGPVDGLAGTGTKNAIIKFERSKFLPETGEVSPALLLLLETTLQAELQTKPAGRSIESVITTATPADANAKMITRIQVGLINFGIPGLGIDGVMGRQTANAIKQFQKRFNMNVDGLPSAELVRKLESVGALTRG